MPGECRSSVEDCYDAIAGALRESCDVARALANAGVDDSQQLQVLRDSSGRNVAHLAATSTLLIVTNNEVTALSDGYALYKRAHMVNPHIRSGLVVNRCPTEVQAESAWDRFRGASQRFLGHSPEYVGWVPTDEAVTASVHERRPVTLTRPDSPAATSLAQIATWRPIDLARTSRAFYDKARKALR